MAQESGVLSQESHLSLGSRLATGDSGLMTADFTKIQDAVDAASPGDTVIVRDGTYIENVDANKSLTIKIGERN